MDPGDLIDSVHDEATFLEFVECLISDRRAEVQEEPDGPSPLTCGEGCRGWYNHSIEDFLEAAVAWAHATDTGTSQGLKDESPWRRFAVFLYCGKIYE